MATDPIRAADAALAIYDERIAEHGRESVQRDTLTLADGYRALRAREARLREALTPVHEWEGGVVRVLDHLKDDALESAAAWAVAFDANEEVDRGS